MESLTNKKEKDREKETLTKVMTHLRDMKQIKSDTDSQFGTMKEVVQLLKKHADQIEMEKDKDNIDYFIKIDTAKTKLIEVNDKAMRQVKEAILPLQKAEGENVKKEKNLFAVKVSAFKVEFGEKVPKGTSYTSPEVINEAYGKITSYYERLKEIEKERDELANKETLFDLERTIYKELKECNVDLVNLKKMWDLIALIDTQFDSWKKTAWDKIDVDSLQTLLKEM